MAPPARFRLLACAGVAAGFWLGADVARAHPDVDRAIEHIERAEFDAALGILESVEAKGGLDRKDALGLLEEKALVELALGRRGDAEQTLRTLVRLAPDHRFAPNTSPDLVTAFESVRRAAPTPIRLAALRERSAKGVVLRADLRGDETGLAPELLFRVRVNGGTERTLAARIATVPLAPGDRLVYRAEARGKLGTLLETKDETYDAPRPARSGASAWWYVAGGAVVALAAVLTIAVVSSGESDRTQPGRPSLEGR